MEPLAWSRVVVQLVVCAVLIILGGVRAVPRFRFAVLGMVAAAGYGMLQDQVSARLCPEYFTVFHPPIPGLTDPTLLGIAWGFLGAWWCGAGMGYVVGLIATLGPRPPLAPRDVARPMLVLLAVVGVVTFLTGLSVWRHAEMFDVSFGPIVTTAVPEGRHRELFVVACYHFVAYATSILGGVVLCVGGERKAAKGVGLTPGRRGASANP